MVSKDVFNKILKQYEDIRYSSFLELQERKNDIYSRIPKIKEIDDEISKLSLQITKSILINPDESKELLEKLQQRSLDLKIEKSELLATNNYPTDYLTMKYKCKICKDTGFINNVKCNCLKQKLINYAYKQSNLSNILSEENFSTFSFDYYSDKIHKEKGLSPRNNIQSIYETCLDFVKNFGMIDMNLLFSGPTGLGKTFLSSCIAKDLIDKGMTVFYQTSFKIFDILEEYKFNKDKDVFDKENIQMLFDVDLLIIDDLGSEFVNSYTSSEFFNILNSRLLNKKKTIISTNLNMNELAELYSERVTSRIFGFYKVLEFFGDDIRKKNSVNL